MTPPNPEPHRVEKLSPFPYQLEGSAWLSTKRFALLADEMGLGKSVQSIRAAQLVGAKRILVVCRAVGVSNWKREFKLWWSGPEPLLTITSYESIHKVEARQFDVLIVDESHYVKEPNAKRTQAILGRSGRIHAATRTWMLTGTPTPNHAAELWTTAFTAGLTVLTYDDFIERFCVSRITAYGRQITGTNLARVGELRALFSKTVLRRTKEEVLKDLPPIFYQDITVEPGPVALGMCQSFVRFTLNEDGLDELTKILEEEIGVVAGIVKGKNGPELTFEAVKALEANAKSIMTLRRYTGLQKVQPVVDLISDELENNAYDKIVLFAVHRDTVECLSHALKKFGAVHIYGGSKPERIAARVEKFQTDPKCRVFIGNIQSAGTSITLTAANQVMFVEQSFVPGDMNQAAMRCHRVGQTKPVTVRFVGLENSIDAYISSIVRRKAAEIAQLVDGLGAPEKKELTGPERPGNVIDLF